jgi:hypothetical protein
MRSGRLPYRWIALAFLLLAVARFLFGNGILS